MIYVTTSDYPIRPESIDWRKCKKSSDLCTWVSGLMVEFCVKGPRKSSWRFWQKSDFVSGWRSFSLSDFRLFCRGEWARANEAFSEIMRSGLVRLTDNGEVFLTHEFVISLFANSSLENLQDLLDEGNFPISPRDIDTDRLLRMSDKSGILMVAHSIVAKCAEAGNWMPVPKAMLVQRHQIATGESGEGPFFEKPELFELIEGQVMVKPEFILKIFQVAPVLAGIREEVLA